MFSPERYQERREQLRKLIGSGVLLFPGNNEMPMNYPANPYHFRQDSSFLYYFGIDEPGLTGIIDADNGSEMIFGDDVAIEDIIWTGPLPLLADKAEKVGISDTRPVSELKKTLQGYLSDDRPLLYLPQYRQDIINMVAELTGQDYSSVNQSSSEELARAVISQRSIKSDEEVAEIEKALDISWEMYRTAMRHIKAGLHEYEVCGKVQASVLARDSHLSFPIIFSVHGETLHNHSHVNMMEEGDIVIMDSGAESPLHYASDITRTIPVSGEFTRRQKDIYETVLQAQLDAIEMMKPGVLNLDCHLKAAHTIAAGLTSIGLMKGDPGDAVEAGAHALFFPHGLGHMMGLDVHDMEGLNEDLVGYDENVTRSDQFGLAYLRLARELEPGFVLTVEPGIYFIPELIDRWKDEGKFSEFIDYHEVGKYRTFGGIRIEDDVLITASGHRVLGKPIAKTVDEVQKWCSE
ncbi:MAG: M24 family metallopeptidase [Candidatus Latescibacteria bacterium]|nr:M24 family metallopeptidase [bacterium]MBD3423575.1 M24 family metallopeptidase [Candidatus Latescibacterota bacterium]